jgi:hypothetical protein
MKLRSAEADPHVIVYAFVPRAETPDSSTPNHLADSGAEAPMPPLAVRPSRGLA